ncbi:MAG: DUF2750 domain-containing protein [Lacunisphaera sp.]
MAWLPNKKEIDAMLAADGKCRYEYFIHRVCDTREMWGLFDDGWAFLGDGAVKHVPLWPHEIFAARFTKEEWSTYTPRQIELGKFLDQWIPRFRLKGMEVAIFPVGSGSSVVVGLDDLESNLRHELSTNYEEEG